MHLKIHYWQWAIPYTVPSLISILTVAAAILSITWKPMCFLSGEQATLVAELAETILPRHRHPEQRN
jgi:hypothetical protein